MRRLAKGPARRGRASPLTLAALLLVPACRDAPAPPDPSGPGWVPEEGGLRLTYSPADDRAPTWTADGSRILYAAGEPDFAPTSPAVLVSVPASGGTLRRALPPGSVVAGASYHTAPRVSPSGDRVAFVDVIGLASDTCPGGLEQPTCELGLLVYPRLRTGALRVRPMRAGPGAEDVLLPFAGRTHDPATGVETLEAHPFQVEFDRGGLPFRPSWAPDGSALVVSDGLRLLTWTLDSTELRPIPGTEDGAYPAWSPDGEWIAYTRLLSTQTFESTCACPNLAQHRITHELTGREVVLVRPDGSGGRIVAAGSEPAWSPDGGTLWFREAGLLWRVAVEGGTPVPVRGTELGREPSVSPDGRSLAFARRADAGTYDIWVMALP